MIFLGGVGGSDTGWIEKTTFCDNNYEKEMELKKKPKKKNQINLESATQL